MRIPHATSCAREVWSDADRVWAGRTAAELVGEHASVGAFVGRRAALALERMAERQPWIARVRHSKVPRAWIGWVVAAVAFVTGAVGVDIGPAHRINLLAPPVLALLVWNIVVYGLLVAALLRRVGHREPHAPDSVRSFAARWLGAASGTPRDVAASGPVASALARFAVDWTALAAPTWQQRAARVLHVAAAALAAGAIAGLYIRGIALEYRAAWESTFLGPEDVARLLHLVLAPGAALTGIAIPDAAHLRELGGSSPGENAAPWIHLYAATITVVVILPRLALAAIAWFRERRLARRFPLRIDGAYFQRLLHAWREGTVRAVAVAYSFDVPKRNAASLPILLTRVFQAPVDIEWLAPVRYGDDALPPLPPSPLGVVIVVFNLAATPERENHQAFAAAFAGRVGDRAPLVVIVDTTEFADRFRDVPGRIAEREGTWRQVLGAQALFVRLAEPDLRAAAAAFGTRLEQSSP
jgi:hypothetical protein